MNSAFISLSLSCDSVGKCFDMIASNACSAFARICALPALSPDESSVLGRSCLLKFPSLNLLCLMFLFVQTNTPDSPF